MINRPRVAISLVSAVASRSGRITSRWNTRPMALVDSTASTAATGSGSDQTWNAPWKAYADQATSAP
jgi:hypothetical protein